MAFYQQKRKYKSFYTSALQYLAYTPIEEIEEKQNIKMLVEMAVAALVSKEIYNFSELLEQPSLVSLKTSESWIYELLEIFNKGDIQRFERFDVGKNVFFFLIIFRKHWQKTTKFLHRRSELCRS